MSAYPDYSAVVDPHRLAALDGTYLLDEDAGEILDRITDLTVTSLQAPAAMVNLVDSHRQVTLRQVGLPGAPREAPLDRSICRHTVQIGAPLVVPDVRSDPRTADNPAVRELGIAAYVGVPLSTSSGMVLGSLCAIDITPRRWSPREVDVLSGFSETVTREVEARAAYLRERDQRRTVEIAADEASRRLALVSEALSASEDRLMRWRADTITRLARATELRSEETGAHIQGVARLCEMIALGLGLPTHQARRIGLASGLHDVGKIAIPDAILHKKSTLTPEERAVMQTHTRIGHDMLAGSGDELLDMAAQIALTHHERFDGHGYPQGLIGQEIPLAGRIVAVADVFDALTSPRCYRPALPIQQALSIMRRERGAHFDHLVLDALLLELGESGGAATAPMPAPPAKTATTAGTGAPAAPSARMGIRHAPQVHAAACAVAARLSVPSVIADRVIAEAGDGARVPPHVAEQIAHSPEAAARVLEAARAITGSHPLGTVHDVLDALGPRRVRAAFATGRTHSVFDPCPGPRGMSSLAFSMRCAQVASAASTLAPHVTDGGSEASGVAWTAGLLHDLGAAVLMAEPDDGGEPAEASPLAGVPPSDHPILGAWLAERWGLGPEAVRAIRCHEDPRPPVKGAVAQAVWLAVRVVETRIGLLAPHELAAAAGECGVDHSTLARLALGQRLATTPDGIEVLTRREADVLYLLAEGMVPKQIAQALDCSPSTVHNHLHHMYRKLGVVNQAQALLAARDRGWV